MGQDILALDVGTSGLKLGVYGPDLALRSSASRTYEPRFYDGGKADIETEAWWSAIASACAEVGPALADVGVVSFSVTSPGLTPLDADGRALGPAILFLDGRSRAQAAGIREAVGEERFLEVACNLPVSGGSSLASILWIREHEPDVWAGTHTFGHTNTVLSRRMTGEWAIDPSTTSITGLYATARDDLTWDEVVLEAAGIDETRLPPLMRSHDPVGRLLPAVADELRLPRDAVVLCGANDASLAAWAGGSSEPGDVNITSGTCDIATVCTDRPIASREFNVRCHVLPGRWLTFFVLNAGGVAYEWFHAQACRELSAESFYADYMPSVLEAFLDDPVRDEREASLPRYAPYLGGSRYTLEPVRATFADVGLHTSRDDLLLAMVRGNLRYLGEHLGQVAEMVPLSDVVGISGGASRIAGMTRARRRWTGAFEYRFADQSSLLGAAMLGRAYLDGRQA